MHALLAQRLDPAHHRRIKNHIGGSVAMTGFSRRDFLKVTGSAAVAAASGDGPCRDGAERQVRPRDQGRRRARPQPVAAGQARHRHPLGRDRGRRERDPGRARREDHRRFGQAGDARPDRPALPRLPLRLGDRHSRRRTGAVAGHHHGGVGGRCRRQQSRGAAPLHRGAIAGADLRLRPHRQQRPVRLPGRRALQHRLRAGGSLRDGAGRKSGFPARRQGADVGERHRQARRSSR